MNEKYYIRRVNQMKTYSMDAIRNIAVMGHGKCGKTTLTEAMLFNAKMTDRMGKVADGNTVTDYDGEEIKRQFSISTALATVEWKDMKYNMIDTPGFFDFVGDVKEGIRAADSALIVLSGRSGVSVGTENVFRYAKQRGVPIMFFVNKIDDDRADYQKTLEEMKEKFGKSVTPFVYPIREGDEFKGFVDIVDMTARRYEGQDRVDIPVPDGMAEIVAPLREMIMEAVAETDEALMVKYFNGEEFTFDEKIGKVFNLCGKKQLDAKSIKAGDIGAVAKLESTKTGDTLCEKGKNIILTGIEFPQPVLSMAIKPQTKGDEEKIISGLNKLMEEDPTFTITNNTETKQTLINGQGEQHIDVIISKLKSKYGVGAVLEDPIVPYRETIKGKATVEGKHKKQSGGHGQYGHVKIEFEPGVSEDMIFEEKVFGGSVPKNYFPAVEKGLRDSCRKGVLAGYPVVNLKATLLDGSYHPVDSSEMAFKTAAAIAYKEGLKQANPVLLEPIGYLKVYIPENIMGDIIGDINKRRGQIMGMGESDKEGLNMVEAEVPMSEMFRYATDLRSMSQGRGMFSFEFTRYEQAPSNVAEKVIQSSKNKE
jgi:small GTP-binding protein